MTCIIVLKKSKSDNKILFIDASAEFVHTGNKNKLSDENAAKILSAFIGRSDSDHFARIVEYSEVTENDYSLQVTSYVEAKDTREVVEITELNAKIAGIVARQQDLRIAIDEIVDSLENARQ